MEKQVSPFTRKASHYRNRIQEDTWIFEESLKFLLPTPLHVFQQTFGRMNENCVYMCFVLT